MIIGTLIKKFPKFAKPIKKLTIIKKMHIIIMQIGNYAVYLWYRTKRLSVMC